MEKSGLVVDKLAKKIRNKVILDDISLYVNAGEIVGLLGPNGAGKTSCFYSIVGLVKPDHGTITLNGNNISTLPIHKRARMGLAYLLQEKSIFSDLTAQDNVKAILEIVNPKNSDSKNTKTALTILEELGIGYLANSNATELSGGERRRVEIARLLASSPSFILMDEPFAAVAPIAIKELQEIIFNLKNRNIGIIITDHSVREILNICDRAYILDQGRVRVEGTPTEIINNEVAQQIYLGDNFDFNTNRKSSE